MSRQRLFPGGRRLTDRRATKIADTAHSWNRDLYLELHAIAARQMRDESGPRTLQPTALLHEAWLRLAGPDAPSDPSALRAAASVAMRHVRIDAARRRRAQRRDIARSVELTEHEAGSDESSERDAYVLALDTVLDRLAQQLPELARLVELRFFLGLELAEIGIELGWSTRTVKRRWQMARGWLHREIRKELTRD